MFISVRQVHREFLRAGADVIQAFSFSMDDKAIDEKVAGSNIKLHWNSGHGDPFMKSK